jgi:hypothetical protein
MDPGDDATDSDGARESTAAMTDTGGTPSVDAGAFDVLGHEIRLAVLEELAAERREAWLPNGLSFSDLFDAVDVDDSGKFNYHLDQLRGRYVHEWDGTYVLTNAGFEVVGAIRAGTFGGDDVQRRGDLDRSCPRCDAGLTAVYEYGYLRIKCDEHRDVLASTLPPAAVTDRDIERIVELALTRASDNVRRVRAGGCPHCWGHTELHAPATPSDAYLAAHDYPTGDDVTFEQVLAEGRCEDCGLRFWLPVSILVADHPAVVAYYHEHDAVDDGVDYLDLAHVSGANGRLVDEDPVRIAVDVSVPDADDALVLTVDETTTVLETRRDPKHGGDG